MDLDVDLWSPNHTLRQVVIALRLVALLTVRPELKLVGRVISTAYNGASSLLEVAEI
jgi:hypothetical protein